MWHDQELPAVIICLFMERKTSPWGNRVTWNCVFREGIFHLAAEKAIPDMSVLITLFEDVLFAHCCHCVGESRSCFLLPVPSAFWKCWHKLFWEGPKIKKAHKRRKRPPGEAFSLILLLHLGSGLQSVKGKISSSWLQEWCFKAKQSCWAVC